MNEESTVKNDLSLLLSHGNLGFYNYCKIEQVVLFNDKKAINYFTHIDFSSKYDNEEVFEFLSEKPIKIGEYKLAISRYIVSIDEFVKIYEKAALSGLWIYDKKEVFIDELFVSEKKFIPLNDPMGGQYNVFVPFEYGLYGSNFAGNYYIHELYSKKNLLNEILREDEILKIQKEIKKCKLNYRIDKLQDRIGNIVCKFNVEVLSAKPKKLGDFGIEYEFNLNLKEKTHTYVLNIVQEHDRIIYKNLVDNDFDFNNVFIEPNQSKTSVSIIDATTGLTLFFGCYDYRVFSNYYSQITPPTVAAQSSSKRVLHFESGDEFVELPNVQMLGSGYAFYEMENAITRNTKLNDEWFFKKGYLKWYSINEHENAIKDILDIINNNLLWDLEELWIIDPYLCADDIIKTAFKCRKQGIVIKALNSYGTIHKNKETQNSMNATEYNSYKKSQSDIINSVLGSETDIAIEYRTVRNGKGFSFHDRYILLRYNINKDRVWSLGASINSIGKTHSIIQIVESPEIIINLFNELWEKTNDKKCMIYSNFNSSNKE